MKIRLLNVMDIFLKRFFACLFSLSREENSHMYKKAAKKNIGIELSSVLHVILTDVGLRWSYGRSQIWECFSPEHCSCQCSMTPALSERTTIEHFRFSLSRSSKIRYSVSCRSSSLQLFTVHYGSSLVNHHCIQHNKCFGKNVWDSCIIENTENMNVLFKKRSILCTVYK